MSDLELAPYALFSHSSFLPCLGLRYMKLAYSIAHRDYFSLSFQGRDIEQPILLGNKEEENSRTSRPRTATPTIFLLNFL